MDPFMPLGGACESHKENQLEPSLWAAPTPVVLTPLLSVTGGDRRRG